MPWHLRKRNTSGSKPARSDAGNRGTLLDASVLERRLLFSATPLGPAVVDDATDVGQPQPDAIDLAEVAAEHPRAVGLEVDLELDRDQDQQRRLELVFVDSAVNDHQQLIDELRAGNSESELEIYLLDSDRDGVEQVTEILQGYRDVDAIHVLSHGNDAKLRIGNATLDIHNLDGYAGALASWQSSLAVDADLLLYGCELAETEAGMAMLEAVSELTGADVAASVDDTGHASLGGDWELEYVSGSVETSGVFTTGEASEWRGVLAAAEIFATSEIRVNANAAGDQSLTDGHNSVAVDDAGNTVVVWMDDTVDGDARTVMAQRFDSTGTKIGSEFQVNTTSAGDQETPAVAMDGTGRFVVAWVGPDGSDDGVFVRRYDASGTAIDASEILVNTGMTAGVQENIAIATNDNNQIVMSWKSDGATEGIYAREFDFTSTPAGNQLSTTLITVDDEATARGAEIDINNSGRFVVVWDDNYESYASTFQFGVGEVLGLIDISNGTTEDSDHAVAVLSNNEYVVTWRSNAGGGLAGVWQTRISATGTVGTPQKVSTLTTANDPSISADENDQYIISYTSGDADGDGVFIRKYLDYDNPLTSAIRINETETGYQGNHSIAVHDLDNFVVFWEGNGNQSGQADTNGVFLRQFGTDTNVAPVVDLGGTYTISEGDSLSIDGTGTIDGDGDTLSFAWDLDNDGNYGETDEPITDTAAVDWATLVNFGIDDDGSYTIGLQVDDGNGGVSTQTTLVTVENTAPTLSVTGNASVVQGATYTLNLSSSDPGDDALTGWRIDWGDGTITLHPGSANSATHTYDVAGLTHNILVSATDDDGRWLAGDFFLGTGNTQPVNRYDALTGSFETSFGTVTTLNTASGILIGPDGMLYVAGIYSDNVERFDPNTGAFDTEFVASGSGGLDAPSGMAFGPDGNLYVASRSNSEILRYDGSSGAFIDEFVTTGSGGLDRPEEIFFGKDGYLYVTSEVTDNVLRYNASTGAFVDEFITSGSGGLNGPSSLAYGRDGNLYIASQYSNEVLRYNSTTGAFIDVFITSGLGGLNEPVDIQFGPDDYLYVLGLNSDNVLRYDVVGNFVDEWVSSPGIELVSQIAFSPVQQVHVTAAPNTIPLATNLNQTKNYTEDDPSIALDDIVVTDPDGGETITATLTLDLPATGSLTTGTFGLATSTYTAGTGVWTVTGSIADVNAALADVAFTPALNNDVNSGITVHVEDLLGDGPADGLIQLNATPQNDAPAIDLDADDSSGAAGTAYNAAFVEDGGAVSIADITDAVITDVDNTDLASLTVAIVNLQDGANEVLTFDTSGTSIVGNFAGGTLSLTGTDTVANYQQVLRTIRYENLSGNPNTTTRTLSVNVGDGVSSQGIVSSVTVTENNDLPLIDLDADDSSGATGGDFLTSFTEGGGSVLIADAIDASLTDADNPNLDSIKITIMNRLDGGSEILSADTSGTGINANYAGGVLTLSNVDTVANYQQVLRTLRYENTSFDPNTTTRLIEFVANDGATDGNTVTASVTVNATNSAPVIDLDANNSSGATGADFNAAFVEGGGEVFIADPVDAVLGDLDNTTFGSLTVTITNLFDGASEQLTADTSGTSISAGYVGGVLSLTGTDSVVNYQQVLRTIRYENLAADPNTTTRTIEFVVNDGASDSVSVTSSVTVTAANNAPVLDLDADDSGGTGGLDYATTFTEGGGAVLIIDAADATLSDADSSNLTQLTVTITNLLDGASEVLSANTGGTSITAGYAGGVLTLSGTDSVANYQQVLRTIQYDNLSVSPNATVRTIEFVASDGSNSGNTATTTLSFNASNNAPAIDLDADDSGGATGADFTASFVEGAGPVAVVDAADATLTDVDSPTLSSLTVTIMNLLGGLAESLSANTSGTSITATYLGGMLTLSGVDSVANYEQVLRTIEYNNTSLLPNTTARVIQFVANDGTDSSNVATATVAITAVDNAPGLDLDADNSSGSGGADFNASFVEGGGAVLITDASDAVISDVDSPNQTSLTVTISNLLDGANEILTADTSGTGITASYAAGTLTLSGGDSLANYQQVLRTIRYDNTSVNPNTTTRLIQFVVNDGISDSNTAASSVTVGALNNAPAIDLDANNSSGAGGADFNATFSEGGAAVRIADLADATIADSDSITLNSLTATITNLLDGGSESLSADTSGTGITASYGGGTLTLSGSDTVASYQQVLRTIQYGNNSNNPDATTRLIQVVANDGASPSNVATARIGIATVNDAPTAGNDQYSVQAGATLSVAAGGLLSNDADPEGNALTVILVSGPASGTLTLGNDGSLVFVSTEDLEGLVTFTYAITDGVLTSGPATVSIEVLKPNDLTDVTPADIQSVTADPAPEPEVIPEEPETIEEPEAEAEPERVIPPVGESVAEVPQISNGGSVVPTSDDEILTLSAITQTGSDMIDSQQEREGATETSDTQDGTAVSRRKSQATRPMTAFVGIGEFDSKLLWGELEELGDQINESNVAPYYFAGTFAGFSGALSVGYVMWTVRGGLLATSLLAHLPAWSFVDPLLVLSELDDEEDDEDDSLENMLKKNEEDSEARTPMGTGMTPSSPGETA